MKRLITSVLVCIFSAAFSCAPVVAAIDDGQEAVRFHWKASVPGRETEKIVAGEPRTVQFHISTAGNVSRVKFSIFPGSRLPGIRIVPEQADVQEGTATSAVEFNVPRGMPLGRHDLSIMISDTATDREIGRGVIRYILIPSGVDCMC